MALLEMESASVDDEVFWVSGSVLYFIVVYLQTQPGYRTRWSVGRRSFQMSLSEGASPLCACLLQAVSGSGDMLRERYSWLLTPAARRRASNNTSVVSAAEEGPVIRFWHKLADQEISFDMLRWIWPGSKEMKGLRCLQVVHQICSHLFILERQ